MQTLKKLGVIFLIIVMTISLAGCKKDAPTPAPAPVAEPTETEKYMAEKGETLANLFEQGFSSGENKCEASIKAEGNDVVFDINIAGFDNLDSESKKEVQATLDSTKEMLHESLASIKSEVPSLETIVFNMNEEDGDLLASVELEY